MGDVDFKVLVRVGFASIAIEGERFPLGWERGVGDKVHEWVAASRLVRREHVRWNGVVDHSGKGGGDVVRGNVGCGKILWVIGWNMCGVEGGGYVVGDLGGRKGGGGGWGCGKPRLTRWKVMGMGRGNGCLLVGGEGVGGGIVFTFFLYGLESRRLHSFRGFFGFSLQVGINLDPSPEAGVLLSQRLHFFSTALLQVCEFLLHLCLAVYDGGQIRGDARRSNGTSIRLLVRSSSAVGGNHLQRKTGTKGVRLVPQK